MDSREIIENPRDIKPHVVLLGAGASRAAFPTGDVSGKRLPVMDDLVQTIGIAPLFEKFKIAPSGNPLCQDSCRIWGFALRTPDGLFRQNPGRSSIKP